MGLGVFAVRAAPTAVAAAAVSGGARVGGGRVVGAVGRAVPGSARQFCRCASGNRHVSVATSRLFSRTQPSRCITTAFTTPRPGLKEAVLPLPEDPREDVVFDSVFGLRSIILNRPDKLNALNGSMIRKIVPRLAEWEKSEMANVVVIKSVGGRAFCAGGDVIALAEWNVGHPEGWRKSAEYFESEYRLNHMIATYKKPYVAFMDGVTMGGGVGLSIHAPFRVATERTVFAMPETTIGFFPDVGASYFLPRLNGALGKYLALTSERVGGASVFYAGIATHYMHSDTLPMLEGRLAELRFRDYDTMGQRLKLINDTLEEYATGLPPFTEFPLQGDVRRTIDRCFSRAEIPDIIEELLRVAREGEVPKDQLPRELQYTRSVRDWALKQVETLQKRSPTSLHVTARLMEEGRRWRIANAFKREYEIACKFMQHPDFTEGVVTQLRSRRLATASGSSTPVAPKWSPASLQEAPSQLVVTQPLFRVGVNDLRLELFTDDDYYEYPHQAVALPSERWLRTTLNGLTPDQKKLIRCAGDVVDLAVQKRGGVRQGLRDVVREMVQRCMRFKPEGGYEWTGGDIDVILDIGEEGYMDEKDDSPQMEQGEQQEEQQGEQRGGEDGHVDGDGQSRL